MKLLTYYTNSHKSLLDNFFIPSIPKSDNFDLRIGTGMQHSATGAYDSHGYNLTTEEKIVFILRELYVLPEGERILFSDCDVVFLKPVMSMLSEYENYDIVFQDGYQELNTGFMLIRNCPVVRTLFEDVVRKCYLYKNDQDALNFLIDKYFIQYTMFGRTVLCPADFIFPSHWNGQKIKIPEYAKVFHACWCFDVENKLKLLKHVTDMSNEP